MSKKSVGIEISDDSSDNTFHDVDLSGFKVGVRIEDSHRNKFNRYRYVGEGTPIVLEGAMKNEFESVVGMKVSDEQFQELVVKFGKSGDRTGFTRHFANLGRNFSPEKLDSAWNLVQKITNLLQ